MAQAPPSHNKLSFIALLIISAAASGLVISAMQAGDVRLAGASQVDFLKPADYTRLVSYQPLPEMDGST